MSAIEDTQNFRLDANVAYGLNKFFYLFGGLNLNQYTGDASDWGTGLGFQGGFGAQFTESVGLHLSYLQMNNSLNENGIDVDLDVSGLELAIHATF